MADYLARAGFEQLKHFPTVADRGVITALQGWFGQGRILKENDFTGVGLGKAERQACRH